MDGLWAWLWTRFDAQDNGGEVDGAWAYADPDPGAYV